jgi:hypothetical protein
VDVLRSDFQNQSNKFNYLGQNPLKLQVFSSWFLKSRKTDSEEPALNGPKNEFWQAWLTAPLKFFAPVEGQLPAIASKVPDQRMSIRRQPPMGEARRQSFRVTAGPAVVVEILPHACCGAVSNVGGLGAGSVIKVPPWPSLAMTKLDAMYWPNSVIFETCVPSLTVNVPPVLWPFGA